MFWNRLLVISLLACGMLALHRASASSRSQDALRSFYVARFFFSDYLPGWSDQILDVTPQGDGVRVRVIRISLANDFCPGLIVRAAERVFPHTSVRKVAGRDICAYTSEGVDAALKAAAPKFASDRSDSATETIVANCGTTQKEFDFPYPVEVDQKVLHRSNPGVSDLWDTNYRVFRRAFGGSFSFNGPTPEQEKEMEQLGTKLVPELISGKYQTAYAGSKCGNQDCDNYLAWRLTGYTEAPQPIEPFVVTLLEAFSLHFTKYVSPIMPRLALVAHISGDVRLLILADPETGIVKSVQTVSGPLLLTNAAVTAAQSWQFAPQTLSGQPLEVTLRFELKCP
ncbi:MAG: energy transducer TonB [Candidatus Acidiferrales bacterium]